MKSAIYMDGKRFIETEFATEEAFEKAIRDNSKTLFGENTIYSDLKNKIESMTLGSAVPDGFLFDFKDEENPEFYLVEVELAKHDFFRHIFPQITKFFAFFKNPTSRNKLIDKLFQFIKSNRELEEEFKRYLGKEEIYKALKDTIENSQNILLVLDDDKRELQEVFETYTDTWDKMVQLEILKVYTADGKMIFTMDPDFEGVGFIEPPKEGTKSGPATLMLEGVDESVREATIGLIAKMNELGNVVYKGKRSCSAYIGQQRVKYGFAGLVPTETALKVIVRTNSAFSDPKGWVSTKVVNWFTSKEERNEREFKIAGKSQIEYAMELIRQSYQIVKSQKAADTR